jgi:two-component system, sensor histidine kinase PdtaS
MTEPPKRPVTQKLGFQIAFVLAIVLLPLTVISIVNSVRAMGEVRARAEAALTGETIRAAAQEMRVIELARGTAATLAIAIAPLSGDAAACSAMAHSTATLQSQFPLIGFVAAGGQMHCTSTGAPFDFSKSPVFQQVETGARPDFSVDLQGPIAAISILSLSHPVLTSDQKYLGFVLIALPASPISAPLEGDSTAPSLDLVTFGKDGEILSSSADKDQAQAIIPKTRPLASLTGDQALTFSAPSNAGPVRVYSVVPLVPGALYVLGSRPVDTAMGPHGLLLSVPILLPALIWIASLVAAWLAVDVLVNRPIRRLNESIKSFASGNRKTTTVEVRGAPLEIREMAAAYEQMTDAVMRDEATLEDSLHQKEVLMREVHHRVKNNLQMIASIMNIQLRKAQTPETRAVVKDLQSRVMSLATIHRELYHTTGVSDIHAEELLDALARQTVNVIAGPQSRIDLRIHCDKIRMTPDQAVPLGLLVSEALMNAVKRAQNATVNPPIIELRLVREAPDRAAVEISSSIAEGETATLDQPLDSADLGAQLIFAFAVEVGGRPDISIANGQLLLRVDFALRPLVEAEDRYAQPAAEPA